jgi:HSP20 family molecular chaperone IbpA
MSLLPLYHDFFNAGWTPERNLVIFKDRDASAPLNPILNVDLIEMEDKFEVHADLPGVNEEDLDISGSVSRSIRLPPNADKNNVNASFENGVLTVTLPKVAPTSTSTKIPITKK